MIRLLIWGAVAWLLYRLVKLFLAPSPGRGPVVRKGEPPARTEEKKFSDISDAHYTDIE